MSISEKSVGDVTVLTVKGKLMGGKESDELYNKVKSVLGWGTKKLIIDLSKVKWLNSQGLGALMACLTSARNDGGDIKLSGSTEKVKSILMVTKLITIFENFDNVDQAVESYG